VIRRVLALALNTFREAVRDRILYLLVVVGLAAVVLSKFLGEVSVGDQLHVVADTGLTAVSLLGVMISIFVGTGLIYKEIDKRTVYTILSKPVGRGEFILGKYLGLLLTAGVCMALLSAAFLLYFPTMGGKVTAPLVLALVFSMVEVAVVIAVAVMFSSASTPILSAVLTSVVFAAGRLSSWIPWYIEDILRRPDCAARELRAFVLQGLYYITPNLNAFDLRDEAVNTGSMPGDLGWRLLYAAGYVAAMLLAAALIFRRRRF
jgi:ABC-type transport system involved in multi-copper enzyme maturation permease subunit